MRKDKRDITGFSAVSHTAHIKAGYWNEGHSGTILEYDDLDDEYRIEISNTVFVYGREEFSIFK